MHEKRCEQKRSGDNVSRNNIHIPIHLPDKSKLLFEMMLTFCPPQLTNATASATDTGLAKKDDVRKSGKKQGGGTSTATTNGRQIVGNRVC